MTLWDERVKAAARELADYHVSFDPEDREVVAMAERALAAADAVEQRKRITHGRHCACDACAQQDWSEPDLAPCGMHGSSCPPRYDPWHEAS